MSLLGMETQETNALQDGELVECIVINRTFPVKYFKTLEEAEVTIKERAEAMGDTFIPLPRTHKQGGLSIQVAITARDRLSGEINEKTIFHDGISPIQLPDYAFTTMIDQFTPVYVRAKSLEIIEAGAKKETPTTYGYNFQRRGGGDKLQKNGYPMIVDLHPDPNKVIDPDVANNMDARWDNLINSWAKLSEEEAVAQLDEALSRRLLIGHANNTVMHYYPPKIGQIFYAKVVRDGKYFKLVVIEWNKNQKAFSYHCQDVQEADETDSTLAKEIYEANEAARMAFMRKKSERPEQATISLDSEDDAPW